MLIVRIVSIVVVGVGLAVQMTVAAHAETRVALVIGNGAYENVSALGNPVNDANLIAGALKTDGFAVTVADDLGHEAFLKTLRAFQDQADSADWAIVYYAGHGIEMAGTNYLIPVDARLAQDRDVADETISLDRVMTAVMGARTLRMVVLDACRNNPFLAAMKRSSGAGRAIGRGLALVEPEQATLVAYSAKAGSSAADGDGADSPFAAALARHLTEPGVEVNKVFRLVRDDVLDATGRAQEPFVYGSLPGRQDFYFQPATASLGADGPKDAPRAIVPELTPEMLFWSSIVNSTNPADFDAYVKRFPAGSFVDLAKNRLVALRPPTVQPDVAPTRLPGIDAQADDAAWASAVSDLNQWDSSEKYLLKYPKGKHADEAQRFISCIIRAARQCPRLQ